MTTTDAKRAAEDAFPTKVRTCAHAKCSRLTTRDRCALHDPLPPEGQWIIAASFKREREGER